MMSNVQLQLKRLANHGTRFLALHYGDRFPFYYVTEYPRSGGTWIAHILSDYLQLPFPKSSLLPVACKSILHNHWKFDDRFARPIYVVRDGRDVAVSMMFYALKRIGNEPYYAKRFPSLTSGKNPKTVFPDFLLEWLKHPVGCRQSWPEHVNTWAFNDNVILVRYEDFNVDAAAALQSLLTKLGEPVDDELLNFTVRKFSFEKQTRREKGKEDVSSNKRKGIIGDWKNYFDRNSAEWFHERAGQALVRLGYAKENWVQELPA